MAVLEKIRLDRKIKIQERIEVTSDTTINPVVTYQDIVDARAQVRFKTGTETYESDQLRAIREVVFTIRSHVPVQEDHRIVYNSKNYEIHSIEEVDRSRYLKIKTKLVSL